ncbi:hypothetical protein [Psychroserpens sp. SPM9]|uniref:hypothetical protein n=1 Tax=Psychroserpens sp. SPM9 TaxID=2975598 RepID=UPI0021A4CF62|nr:hypothetical protein [Psychroserpens sp. SPM9]MDG5490971.1 hypothetical protein [Psychroserpens sp. SPM9]
MKFKIAIVILFMIPSIILSQSVILEAEPVTEAQKRVQAIRAALKKLEDDYAASKLQHEKNTRSLSPNSFSLNSDKKILIQKKKDIQAVLYSIQESGLKEKAREIDILRTSLGNKFSYSLALQKRIDRLNDNFKKINNHLNGIKKAEGEEETDRIKHDVEVSKLDQEISNLDDLLAASKVEPKKKTKNLDDFLKETGRTNKPSSNNLDDLLDGDSDSKKKVSNNLDDLLSSSSEASKTKDNNLDAMLDSAEDDTDFKIDYKNGLTGVINSRGKPLIPYRDWEILEYKMGIAKVRKELESKFCYETCTAYKVGFVDFNGEFIDDGFEIDFSYSRAHTGGPLKLIAIESHDPNKETFQQFSARKEREEKARERKKALEKKQKEIKKKKCKIELYNWQNSIKSRYR